MMCGSIRSLRPIVQPTGDPLRAFHVPCVVLGIGTVGSAWHGALRCHVKPAIRKMRACTSFLYDVALPRAYDSPRFGVWPDGYDMTANELTSGDAFGGVGVFAFDRAKMLVGDATAGFIDFP